MHFSEVRGGTYFFIHHVFSDIYKDILFYYECQYTSSKGSKYLMLNLNNVCFLKELNYS